MINNPVVSISEGQGIFFKAFNGRMFGRHLVLENCNDKLVHKYLSILQYPQTPD